ncbi:MAG: DUF1631 family protein [Thermomonas sp.]|uniref:DUF1631 family protein n=1 Tax=Thermomonas sp. TaxID=1971895 RepID=UPI0039E2C78F
MTFRSPADTHHSIPHRDRDLLLDALQKLVLDRVPPALDRTLGNVDDYLFDRSQNGEEDLGLMALRDVRRARATIAERFRKSVHAALLDLRVADAQNNAGETRSDLRLLSDQDLEEELAVQQLAALVQRQHGPSLELLLKRLSALLGHDLASMENPFSPAFLANALGDAMAQVEMEAALRIVMFKFFERELAGELGEIYHQANAKLAAAGILPELRATSRPVHAATHAPVAAAGAQHVAPQAVAMPQAQGDVPLQPGLAEQAMFANMLGLLQGWRSQAMGAVAGTAGAHMPGQPGMAAAQGQVLGSGELLSILSLMQREAPLQFAAGAGNERVPLAAQLRQQMAQNARKLGVADDNLQLDGLDGDAVDLVALLFDVLLDGPQYDANIRQMIGRMLVPYVKVAVKDRRMFLFKQHPARRLLNTVAEACEGNHGEAPQERELLNHVDHTIDRLVAEFNEDVAIFETLEQELRSYMAQHRKRFELAEKRTAEAQRGRERMDQARILVLTDLDRHRAGRELPPVIEDFLARHAAHHLVQVVLREGNEAPRYEAAMATIDGLLAAHDCACEHIDPGSRDPLPESGLEDILASAGCTGDAAQAAIAAIRDALARLAEGEASVAADVRMPEQVVVPEPIVVQPEPQPHLQVVGGTDALDFDGSMLERMRKLEVGDWLQLAGNDGRAEPAKVSWISPISARLLLVNKRGVRVLVASVEELAAMAKLGKVSLREAGSAFDDAMHQVADRLKSAAAQS